jgi:hypothetical protein
VRVGTRSHSDGEIVLNDSSAILATFAKKYVELIGCLGCGRRGTRAAMIVVPTGEIAHAYVCEACGGRFQRDDA